MAIETDCTWNPEILTFIVEMTKAVVWPVLISAILFFYRDLIASLANAFLEAMKRMRLLKYGQFELATAAQEIALEKEAQAESVSKSIAKESKPEDREKLVEELRRVSAEAERFKAMTELWSDAALSRQAPINYLPDGIVQKTLQHIASTVGEDELTKLLKNKMLDDASFRINSVIEESLMPGNTPPDFYETGIRLLRRQKILSSKNEVSPLGLRAFHALLVEKHKSHVFGRD